MGQDVKNQHQLSQIDNKVQSKKSVGYVIKSYG